MKKLVSLLLALCMLMGIATIASAEEGAWHVAMITDYGDITDQSFNQTTYEACKAFCDANGIDFTYYKPVGDSTADRCAMVDTAVGAGYNVIVMPGYAFGETIAEEQDLYPDVKFIALDVGEGDLGGATLSPNTFSAVYQEELCGYMAGYAAVKLGYTHLGFLGGMAVPAVVRYGYGFVQGADAAAAELDVDATCEYVYANQFFGDADITAYMDNWYQTLGVQVVFACGGGVYTSAAEAAQKVDGGKVIGVDVDQAALIDSTYGEGMTVTSAMKGLAATVDTLLAATCDGLFDEQYGGHLETLGLVSGDDPSANYVQLGTTQWSDSFTEDDYKALVAAMYDGSVTVSNDTTVEPTVSKLAVNYLGNVK